MNLPQSHVTSRAGERVGVSSSYPIQLLAALLGPSGGAAPSRARLIEIRLNGYSTLMTNDKAAQARDRLLGSIAGKAKEVAGAVSGKDDLAEEGQLQQVEARGRKEAVADEAIADAQRQEAGQELRESTREAAARKSAAHADAAREKSDVERERNLRQTVADLDAEAQAAEGREVAQARADEMAEIGLRDAAAIAEDASSTEQKAATEEARLEQEAATAEQEAANLRTQTQN